MGVKIRKIRGSWYVVVDYKTRRKSKCVGHSKEVALQVRRQVEAALLSNDMSFFDGGEMTQTPTVEDYADKWLKTYIKVRFKPATFFTYRASLDTHTLPILGKKRLNEITPADVEQFIYQLATQAEPLAQKTISLALTVLRSMLNHAKKAKLITTNPAANLEDLARSNKPERKVDAMTRKERDSFLAAVKELFPHMYAFFLTAVRTGMRRGELAALHWADVNLGENENGPDRYILVRENYVYRTFGTPKSGKDRRVDVSKQLRAVLLELRDEAILKAMQTGKPSIMGDLVFHREGGEPLVVDNLQRQYMEPSLTRAGLRRFTIHQLRHTYATLQIKDGVPLPYISKQLGHSSIKITVDIYGHFVPGADIAWADRQDQETTSGESANQAQTAGEREKIETMEETENAAITSTPAEVLLITPPCICGPVRPLPS